jgi:hypothetical protein
MSWIFFGLRELVDDGTTREIHAKHLPWDDDCPSVHQHEQQLNQVIFTLSNYPFSSMFGWLHSEILKMADLATNNTGHRRERNSSKFIQLR